MMQQVALFLLDMILQPFIVILLLRFHLQWLRAPMRNAVGEFIMAITNFVVLRTRRYVPSFRGYDSSTLLLAFVLEMIYMYLYEFIWLYSPPGIINLVLGLLIISALKLITMSIYILIIAVIIQAVLSWLNPHTPLAPILNVMTWPFIRPLRQRIPPVGNIDLSALVLIIICQLIIMVPVALLDKLARNLL